MFKKLLKRVIKNTPIHHQKNGDHDVYPVLTAEEIYQCLNLHTKLRNIKRKVSIDPERFEMMYAKPIARFCERVQLIPASQSYHHAYPGGLIYHTLTVIEAAINERYKYTLPLASEPEIIEAQKNLWTYIVFASVLIHDVGKSITMVRYIDHRTNKIISPIARSLKEQGVKEYTIEFEPTIYFSMHERIGSIFLGQLFDPVSLEYLTHNLDVFGELLGYINKDEQSWGSIGEIVRKADQFSVASDLRIANASGRKRQFSGADIENFGERLMRTVRYMIEHRQLVINRPGAVMFVSDDERYVYAVSKTLAEKIRETMKALGATDIPTDNTRIFDELQQNGLIETSASGKAIYNIHVSIPGSGFEQDFTVLKIDYRRVFSVKNAPMKLQGTVKERLVNAKDTGAEIQEITLGKAESLPQEESNQTLAQDEKPQAKEPNETTVPENSDALATELAAEKTMPIAVAEKPIEMSAQEIVEGFFEWILERIENKTIIVNRSGQPVYKVEHNDKPCLAVVTPKTFADYAISKKLFIQKPGLVNLDRESMLLAASIIQAAMHKLKSNVPAGSKQIHYMYSTSAQSAKARLSFYLFRVDQISNSKLREFLEECAITDLLTNVRD